MQNELTIEQRVAELEAAVKVLAAMLEKARLVADLHQRAIDGLAGLKPDAAPAGRAN